MSIVQFKADFNRKLNQFFNDPDNCRYAEQVRHYLFVNLQSPNYKRFLTHQKIVGALRHLTALKDKPEGLDQIIERMQHFQAELYYAFQRNASYGEASP